MEVSVRHTLAKENRSSSNSFDCDSSALDAILGLNPNGERQLRVDRAATAPRSHFEKRSAQVYAPLEVIHAAPTLCTRGSNTVALDLMSDTQFKRERLVRLLDRQQTWYDAS
jgi:hypothetical protein